MPGFLYHLSCADAVARTPRIRTDRAAYNRFLVGSLLPDLATDKDKSHYRSRNADGWLVPDAEAMSDDVGENLYANPFLGGAYSHLVLDQIFLTDVISARYALKDGVVYSKTSDATWTIDDFLSVEHGIYADYSYYNMELISKKLVPTDKIFNLRCKDDDLDAACRFYGWGALDYDRDWRGEIRDYLANPAEAPLGFFDFNDLFTAIRKSYQHVYDKLILP